MERVRVREYCVCTSGRRGQGRAVSRPLRLSPKFALVVAGGEGGVDVVAGPGGRLCYSDAVCLYVFLSLSLHRFPDEWYCAV